MSVSSEFGAQVAKFPLVGPNTPETPAFIAVVRRLSIARSLPEVMEIVTQAARTLLNADGITFVMRREDFCFYAEEDAISPLWKGRRFPINMCISGWCMLKRRAAVITDIYQDARIPHDAYRPTFVRSLMMVPVFQEEPVGALGAYWAETREISASEVALLQSIANAASLAVAYVNRLYEIRELYNRESEHRIALANANAELILARDLAENGNRAKSAFLANMSHDLRTPLNAILGFSEVIRDKMLANNVNRYAEYGADIHRAGQHLLNIVNDVLDLTAIEAGKLELHEEEISVSAIFQECLTTVRPQAASAHVALHCAMPDPTAFILGDRTKLKQVIVNLLSNAIKFTPEGGSVDINSGHERDGGMRITIQDTGIGMTELEVARALELFGQVDSSVSKKFQGTGLGLPLSVQLTELHGGSLRIKSAPGNGTAVRVRLPAWRVRWLQRKREKNRNNVIFKIAS
jgi:signal transduction histidine kinase